MAKLTVNNQPIEYRLPGDTPLLFALREASNLTGTKYGCGNGDCGACMVAIEGEAIRSCLVTLDEVEGRYVTTIEALSRDRSHPVQQAFAAANVGQCGFCLPSLVISAAVLLDKNPDPSTSEIKAAIKTICRCGSYPRLADAIKRAGRVKRRVERLSAVPPPGISPEEAASQVPSMKPVGIDPPGSVEIGRDPAEGKDGDDKSADKDSD